MPRINLVRRRLTDERLNRYRRMRIVELFEIAAKRQDGMDSEGCFVPEVVLAGQEVTHFDDNGYLMPGQKADQAVNKRYEKVQNLGRKVRRDVLSPDENADGSRLVSLVGLLAIGPNDEIWTAAQIEEHLNKSETAIKIQVHRQSRAGRELAGLPQNPSIRLVE